MYLQGNISKIVPIIGNFLNNLIFFKIDVQFIFILSFFLFSYQTLPRFVLISNKL